MQVKNTKTIQNAFKRLVSNEGFAIIDGMKALLEASVIFALQRHAEKNLPAHRSVGDSYGWALGYQGQCVAIKVNVGESHSDDSVRETLESEVVKASTSKNKYVGIVMAGMDPPSFYRVEHEEEILNDTMNMVAGDFDRYFHEI